MGFQDRRLENQWDRQLEDAEGQRLPDCRLTGARREITSIFRGRMQMDLVFCADCGKHSGFVTSSWTPHVFFVCNDCVARKGPPPGCVEAPAELVEGGATWPPPTAS